MITKNDFKRMSAESKGYFTYLFGCRDDEPNIPDEENPYLEGSAMAARWDNGQRRAIVITQDDP